MSAAATASTSRRRLIPWISLVIVWVVWGSTYLAIRVLVHEAPPLLAASVRFFCAGLLMGAMALWIDRRHGWPTPQQLFDSLDRAAAEAAKKL